MSERMSSGENAYGREKFERNEAHTAVERLATEFGEHYKGIGYQEVPEVKVSSGIDPSVRFIGSHISVFKPEIIERRIPQPGEYMIQECIRTKNARELFNDSYYPNFGSSFRSLGAISNYDRLNDVSRENIDFFIQKLGLKFDNIRIRISSRDQDLLTSISGLVPKEIIEVDTQADAYYRHKIGIEGVVGRNYNIALMNADRSGFTDVGNIIVLEDGRGKLGVETALGASTILKQIYGLDHVNDCYPVSGLEAVDSKTIKRKLEDSIIVCTTLLREGLTPRATENKERLLRTYLRAISYLRVKAQLTLADVNQIISDYELKQFPGQGLNVATIITTYLDDYEQGLAKGKISTKEDEVIASVLRQ